MLKIQNGQRITRKRTHPLFIGFHNSVCFYHGVEVYTVPPFISTNFPGGHWLRAKCSQSQLVCCNLVGMAQSGQSIPLLHITCCGSSVLQSLEYLKSLHLFSPFFREKILFTAVVFVAFLTYLLNLCFSSSLFFVTCPIILLYVPLNIADVDREPPDEVVCMDRVTNLDSDKNMIFKHIKKES